MIYLKSSYEIGIMRSNGEILKEIFEKLNEYIKPGITTKSIDDLVYSVIIGRGALPSFKNYGGNYPSSRTSAGFPASACVSVNEQVIHGIPGESVLREGDIVSIDLGAFKNGFHVDAARTYPVGEISEVAKKLIEVAERSFWEGFSKAVVGGRITDIAFAVQKCVESEGFGVVRDMMGHGIGRSLHEDPSVPNFGPAGKGPKMRQGLVIAIEPMITAGSYKLKVLPDNWTMVTEDLNLSAHYENTVAITSEGPQVLTL